MKSYYFVPIFALLFFYSCKHKTTFPEGSPEISYSKNISPIINNNCKSCHEGYGTYDGLSSIVNTDKPAQSKLYFRITAYGEERMPPSHSLNEAQIRLIYAWIAQGAKNN